MATVDDVVQWVRIRIRDTAEIFFASRPGDGLATVFDMPYVCIEESGFKVTLQLNTPTLLVADTDYILDDRHGAVQLLTYTPQPDQLISFEGQHYTWFVTSDLQNFVQTALGRLTQRTEDKFDFDTLSLTSPRFELLGLATIIEGFWSLLAELALDVDMRNPEGIDLPASERFQQVRGMLEQFEARYVNLANKLNIGVDAIEMFTLRRVSMYTGRLVPVYVEQEIDDETDPVRVYPAIDLGATG